MVLRQLYKRRTLYTTLGALSILSPFPGITLGLLIQAKYVDIEIKREALRMEAEAKR